MWIRQLLCEGDVIHKILLKGAAKYWRPLQMYSVYMLMNYRTLLPTYLIQLQDPKDLQFGSFIFKQQQGLRHGDRVRKVCWNGI